MFLKLIMKNIFVVKPGNEEKNTFLKLIMKNIFVVEPGNEETICF